MCEVQRHKGHHKHESETQFLNPLPLGEGGEAK